VNSRGDSSTNSNSSNSEIKPVEPRKQAIPISKLRQPSKLRLRPNILVSYIIYIINKTFFCKIIIK